MSLGAATQSGANWVMACFGKQAYATAAGSPSVEAVLSFQPRKLSQRRPQQCSLPPPSGARRSTAEKSMGDKGRAPRNHVSISVTATLGFWDLVDQSAGPEGCWPWLGPKLSGGTGRYFGGERYERAGRVAYLLARERQPGARLIATCKSVDCVNPSHLCPAGEEPTAKRCTRCREIKPIGDFYSRQTGRRLSECKACSAERNSRAPKRGPATVRRLTNNKRRASPLRAMLSGARARARAKGLPFTLSEEDVIIPDRCPVLGIPLKSRMGLGGNAGGFHQDSPSLDRIDNSRGYTPDNVVVVSNRANRLKMDATVEELEALASFYRRLKDGSTAW